MARATKTPPALEESARLGAKHQVTIPHRVAKRLKLKEGDYVLLRLVGHKLELVPIPKDQLWFWTPQWQKKEREADREIARGNVKSSDSV